MASQVLLDQFWKALNDSKTFQKLTPEEQAALKKAYVDVTDEQLILALEELKKDAVRNEQLEKENEILLKQQEEMTRSLQETLKTIEKEEIKENNLADQRESSQAAEAALAALGVGGDGSSCKSTEPKPKRKKWFGLF